MKTTQYLWIVRYGLTEHQLIEGIGPYDSDIDPTIGMQHANAIAQRIVHHPQYPDAVPDIVYSDPFLRTTHTADVIVKEIIQNRKTNEDGDSDRKIHKIEEGITEWQVSSLLVNKDTGIKTHPRTVEQLSQLFPENIDVDYTSINPQVAEDVQDANGAPKFEETETDLFVRCATTTDKILTHLPIGNENICLVSHAPCNQAIVLYLEGTTHSPNESTIVKPWSLGGLTLFSRSIEANHGNDSATPDMKYGKWNLAFYSNTDHMPGEYKEGIKGRWSLPSFDK